MRALVYNDYGPPDSLAIGQVSLPHAGHGEVLIHVHYAGVNPVDWKMGEGRFQAGNSCTFPLVVGRDVAGVVEDVGLGVTSFKPGDRVVACLPSPGGGFAEFAVAPSNAVAPSPKSLPMNSSAAKPLVFLTAWQSLIEIGALKANQKVLILSGAGGTGSMAVQIARHQGAHVIALTSRGNRDYVRALGAHEVFDYQADDLADTICAQHPEGLDLVFSNVLGPLHRMSYDTLRPGGTLVTIGEDPIRGLAAEKDISVFDHLVRSDRDHLSKMAQLVDGGLLNPPEITEFTLENAQAALEESLNGHTRGKLVLRVC
jgi:NADPH2:quinone reductase